MATFQRVLLSGSTNGDPIKVVATATPGTAIHTAVSGTSAIDEVTLYVSNTDTVTRTITVEWGGTTDPDHLISKAVSVPASSGPTLLVDALPVNNANAVAAFASTANVLLVTGKVTRIVP